MNLDIYLDISGRWLVDVTSIYDLAESLFRAMRHDYQIPTVPSREDGPFVSSYKGREALQEALPLIVKTSIEAAKAAELTMGVDHQPDASGRTLVPFVTDKGPRVGAILARAGIIAQFELWKSFAASVSYPFNKKQADRYSFPSEKEKSTLLEIVDMRNSLTHEITIANDPTMRQLVEYAYKCQYLAKQAALAANKSSKRVPHSGAA